MAPLHLDLEHGSIRKPHVEPTEPRVSGLYEQSSVRIDHFLNLPAHLHSSQGSVRRRDRHPGRFAFKRWNSTSVAGFGFATLASAPRNSLRNTPTKVVSPIRTRSGSTWINRRSAGCAVHPIVV